MRIENGGGFRLETETSVGYLEFNATARRYEFQATWQPETEGPPLVPVGANGTLRRRGADSQRHGRMRALM